MYISSTQLRPHTYTPSRPAGLSGRIIVPMYIYIKHIYTYHIATLSLKYTACRQAELRRQIVAIYIYRFQTQERQYTYAAGTSLDELGRLSSRAGLASTLLCPARPAAVCIASRVVINRSCSLTSPANETGGGIHYVRRRTYVYVCRACHVVPSLFGTSRAGLGMSCHACLACDLQIFDACCRQESLQTPLPCASESGRGSDCLCCCNSKFATM